MSDIPQLELLSVTHPQSQATRQVESQVQAMRQELWIADRLVRQASSISILSQKHRAEREQRAGGAAQPPLGACVRGDPALHDAGGGGSQGQ